MLQSSLRCSPRWSSCGSHGIGTQIPAAVQVALPTGVKAPRVATVLRMKT